MDVEAMRFPYSQFLEEWFRSAVMHEREITELCDERSHTSANRDIQIKYSAAHEINTELPIHTLVII